MVRQGRVRQAGHGEFWTGRAVLGMVVRGLAGEVR